MFFSAFEQIVNTEWKSESTLARSPSNTGTENRVKEKGEVGGEWVKRQI